MNGRNQEAKTTRRFTYISTLSGGVSAAAKLTATAIDSSNNTSEFSDQVTVATAVQSIGLIRGS